ncbi:MAG: M4 family metallopeptidase, partial [Ilumatobacteraceae bacterium]
MDAEGGAGTLVRLGDRRARRPMVTIGLLTLFAASSLSWGRASAQPPVIPSSPSLVVELQRQSDGQATVAVRPETGAATFIGGSAADPLAPPSGGPPSKAARTFIDHYAPLFGVADPATDLTEQRVFTAESGNSAVRFQQRYAGLPVLAGEVAVQVGADGSVLSTSGETLPGIAVDVTPQVSATVAADLARNVAAKYDAVDINTVRASTPELWIYDPSLIGADGPPGTRLVWRVEARTDLGDVDRLVLVDAHSGTVALQFNQREDALVRSVCDNANNPSGSQTCSVPVRNEGGPPVASGTGAADINGAYDLTGVTYDFYNALGRNSVDNAGLPLKSTVRFCDSSDPCPYANAFWNGSQMVYGQGYAGADDVVAHELTHGVTQFTSQLLYYAESGAINESMSDVMGELVDLGSTVSGPDPPTDRWLMGEQLPGGAIRSMSDPTIYNDPDRMTSPLYSGSPADSHGVHTNSSVGNKAAFLITDGGTFNGQTITGLGPAKAASIYYEVETTLLGPGSDYLDLFHALPQACTNLIGTAGITAGDCGEVTKAVTATEMDKFPTTAGAHRSAPLCDAGTGQSGVLFSDNMETNSGSWSTSATMPAGQWRYFSGSSQSGSRSLFAADLDSIASATLLGTFTISVPAGATFLRFDHSYQFDSDAAHFYDGGVVEYSTDGGSNWADAVALPGPTVNGYDGLLENVYGNPLGNRLAFSGASPGYQTTRINLSTLSGRTVKLRFRLGSDNSVASVGWFIDDVVAYTCAAVPSAPSNVVAVGGDHSVALTWQAPADGGSPITSYTITPFIGGVAQPPVSTPTPATSFTLTGLVSGASDTFTVAAANTVGTGLPSPQSNAVIPLPTVVSLLPARLLESRSGLSTVDGLFNGVGLRGAGSVTALRVVGRGGVAGDAVAVVLNVTVTEAQGAGYVTVFPCGGGVPTASSLDFV